MKKALVEKRFIKVLLAFCAVVSFVAFTGCPEYTGESPEKDLFEGTYDLPEYNNNIVAAGNERYSSSVEFWDLEQNKLAGSVKLKAGSKEYPTFSVSTSAFDGKNLWVFGGFNGMSLARLDIETGEFKYVDYVWGDVANLAWVPEALEGKGALVVLMGRGGLSGYSGLSGKNKSSYRVYVVDKDLQVVKSCTLKAGNLSVENFEPVYRDGAIYFVAGRSKSYSEEKFSNQESHHVFRIPLNESSYTEYTVPFDSLYTKQQAKDFFEAFYSEARSQLEAEEKTEQLEKLKNDIENLSDGYVELSFVKSFTGDDSVYMQAVFPYGFTMMFKVKDFESKETFAVGNRVLCFKTPQNNRYSRNVYESYINSYRNTQLAVEKESKLYLFRNENSHVSDFYTDKLNYSVADCFDISADAGEKTFVNAWSVKEIGLIDGLSKRIKAECNILNIIKCDKDGIVFVAGSTHSDAPKGKNILAKFDLTGTEPELKFYDEEGTELDLDPVKDKGGDSIGDEDVDILPD